MNSIAVAHAFAFTVGFKEDDDGAVKEEIEHCVVMSLVFHLIKMRLTECIVPESPSWIKNGKGKLDQ